MKQPRLGTQHNLELARTACAALLAKAFCGELVPQDPNDEPAAALLERVRSGKR